MTFLLNTPESVAADLELSERIGAELLADPTPGTPAAPVARSWTTQVRRVNLQTGDVRIETLTEKV
jgi:hypothetical protein